MVIGISGINGFVGGTVSKYLSKNEYIVVPLHSLKHPGTDKDHYFAPGMAKLDWMLHFAATTSIEKSFRDPIATFSNNIGSTLAALEIAKTTKSAFLLMSSYVYGKPQYLPIDEQHPVSSLNPYMQSKIIAEDISKQVCEIHNIPLVILRGFNIYGDCNIKGRLISDALTAVRLNKPIILNDANPKRDYLYIKDFQSLILKIISDGSIKTGVYNVGYGKSHSNIEVAELIKSISGVKEQIVVKSNPRVNEIEDCVPDVSRVKKTFSWEPMFSLEEGICDLMSSLY